MYINKFLYYYHNILVSIYKILHLYLILDSIEGNNSNNFMSYLHMSYKSMSIKYKIISQPHNILACKCIYSYSILCKAKDYSLYILLISLNKFYIINYIFCILIINFPQNTLLSIHKLNSLLTYIMKDSMIDIIWQNFYKFYMLECIDSIKMISCNIHQCKCTNLFLAPYI